MSGYPEITKLPERHHNRVRMHPNFFDMLMKYSVGPAVCGERMAFMDREIVLSNDVEDYEFYERPSDRACPTCGHRLPMTNAERQRKYREMRRRDTVQ